MLYPRFLVRTSQAASAMMLLLFMLSMLVAVAGLASLRRSPIDQVLPFGCAAFAYRVGRRVMSRLQELESQRTVPDEEMLLLFDLTLALPVLGVMAVAGSTWLQIAP